MSEWKKVKLGDVISISSGFSYKSDYLGEGDNLLLGMGCVSFKDSFVDSGARPYSQDCDDKYLVKPGDIVLATRQQSNNLPILAMPAIIPQKYAEKKLIVGANLYKVENRSDIDNRFIYYLLKGHDYVGYINGVKTGANVQMVSKRNVEAYSFLCPPLETCNRIATILSRYDSLIENYQKQIKLLEEATQRLYKEWFIDLHFPGHENTNIIDGVPEGWGKKKVGEIAKVNANSISKTYPHSIIEYVDLGSVREGRIFEKTTYQVGEEPGRAKRIAKDGDVIWGMVRPNLKSFALVMNPNATEVYSTGFAILSALSVPFTFLYCSVTTDAFVRYLVNCTNGAAYPAVKAEHFINAEITVPTNTLLDEFGRITIPLYRKIEKISAQLRLLTEARDRLLPKLMSGAIVA